MRILLLSSVEHQSGSALRFRALAGALARRGHDVHLMEPVVPGTMPETPEGVRRHPCPRLPVTPAWQAPLWAWHGASAVLSLRPEICWTLKALPNVWIPARLARRLGAHVAVDLDDLDEAYYPEGVVRRMVAGFFRTAAREADDVTTHTEPLRRRIEELREGRSAPVFVEQPVDTARFAHAAPPPGLRERLGLGEGPVLLYAGHLGPASDLGPLLATLRVVDPGVKYTEPSIGRVATAPEARGTGLGKELMRRGIAACGGAPIRIGAQAHLEKFYGELGFIRASEPYDEDGIPHIEMIRA